MKLNILLLFAVLLVGCGSKANKTTAENTAPSDVVAILINGAYIPVDLDFDGKEEIVTDLQYGEGHRGCGTYQSVYKVQNDSLIEMRIDLLDCSKPANAECVDYKIEKGLFGVNLQTQEVYYVRIGGGLDRSYHIFKPANSYTYTLPTTGEPLFVMQYRLSRIISYRYHTDGHSSMQIDYYEKTDCDLMESKSADITFFQNDHLFPTNVGQTAVSEAMDQNDLGITFIDHDSVSFSYIEPVEDYHVSGMLVEYLNDTNVAFVDLNFRHCKTGKEFAVHGGSVSWRYFLNVDSIPTAPVRLNYPNILANGVIIAPYNTPFFFADLDFDGQKELITGNHVHAGTQRGVGRYTDIYKIIDGEPHEATQEFLAKSKILTRWMNSFLW